MKWLAPWYPLEGSTAEALVGELNKELCDRHILFGIPMKALGKRDDCDDVVFELIDGSLRVAVVHLTYAQRPEINPQWPRTDIFNSWVEFEQNCMLAENMDSST